jgi:hypothetical protein
VTPERQAAEQFVSRLRSRYLSLAASGRTHISLGMREDLARLGPEALSPAERAAETPAEGKLEWDAAEGTAWPEIFKIPEAKRWDVTSVMTAVRENPYLEAPSYFDAEWLATKARLKCAPDGSATVEIPGADEPGVLHFASDGRLLSSHERQVVEIGRYRMIDVQYDWMEVGGGLLLQRITKPWLEGQTLVESFEYRVFGDLLLPSEVLVGMIPPPRAGSPQQEQVVIAYTVAGATTDRGDSLAPAGAVLRQGQKLEGLAPLLLEAPGPAAAGVSAATAPATAGASRGTAPPVPGTGGAALPSAQEIGRRLDVGLQRLDATPARDIACTLKLTQGGPQAASPFYWLAPASVAVAPGPGAALPPALTRLAGEALAFNPFLRGFEASFAGGTVQPIEDGRVIVKVPAPGGGRRKYELRAMPPQGTSAELAARNLISVASFDERGRLIAAKGWAQGFLQPREGGALLSRIVLECPEKEGGVDLLELTYKYTRDPGSVFLKRLTFEGKRAAGGPPVVYELVLEEVKAGQGLAEGYFKGLEPKTEEEKLFD